MKIYYLGKCYEGEVLSKDYLESGKLVYWIDETVNAIIDRIPTTIKR